MNVLDNDSDPDGDRLTVQEAHSSTGIPVAIAADGTLSFTLESLPSASFELYYTVSDGKGGTASAIVQVVRIRIINYPPRAQDDSFNILPSNEDVLLDVLANDTDPERQPLVITAVDDFGQDFASVSADGRHIVYHSSVTETKTRSLRYTISDAVGQTSVASVTIYNPFSGTGAIYHSLIGKPHGIGSAQMRVTETGLATGAVKLGRRKFRFRGQLSGEGDLSVILKGGEEQPELELSISRTPSNGGFSAQLIGGDRGISFEFNRTLDSARRQLVGYYTIALPANPALPSQPQGNGFAIMRVRKSGAVAVIGKFGDGTPFSTGSRLYGNVLVQLYARAYNRAAWQPGGITGSGVFKDQSGRAAFNGFFQWVKLPQPGARFYPQGFMGQFLAKGNRFSLPLGASANALFGSRPLKLELAGGNLSEDILRSVTFATGSEALVSPVGGDRAGLWLNPHNGLVRGSFIHPVSGRRTVVSGIVLPEQKRAFGVFRGVDEAGSMRLNVE